MLITTTRKSNHQTAVEDIKEQNIYTMSVEDQELLAVYKVSIDLRHVSNYSGYFNYEQQWEIILKYIYDDGKELKIVFDNSFFPEPTGYFFSSTVPFR